MKPYRQDRTTATSVQDFLSCLIFAFCSLLFPMRGVHCLPTHRFTGSHPHLFTNSQRHNLTCSQIHTPLQPLNPPSTSMVSPEMKPDASLSKKISVPVSSEGSPSRP